MEIIQSPIFYMGNKYELLKQLIPLFPKDIDTLYDLFGGSGVVSLNVKSKTTIYNELNANIYNLFQLFKNTNKNALLNHLKGRQVQFNLFDGNIDIRINKQKQEEIRKKYEQNYLNFRKYYNETKNIKDLYTLTFYSFCNLLRFNKKSEFNMPFGFRSYTVKYDKRITDACDVLNNKNIIFKNEDAFDMLENTVFNKNDFIYLDPPYSNTTAIYNEKRAFGGWKIEDDYRLFTILENLDKQGIKWGLSNVFRNKGIENKHLIEWCNKNKWNVNHLNKNYASLGKGNAKSDEVYICNYKTQKQISLFDMEVNNEPNNYIRYDVSKI